MATHPPFIIVPPSLTPLGDQCMPITPSLSNAESLGISSNEASLDSSVTSQTSILCQPLTASPFIPPTSPESPTPASTGIQLFSSYATPSPRAPCVTLATALVNAPVSKTIPTGSHFFSCYTTPSPAAPTKAPPVVSTSALPDTQDAQIVVKHGDEQTKNEREPPAPETSPPTLPTVYPSPSSASASCAESTVAENPCSSQEQTVPGNYGTSNEEVNCSEEAPGRLSSLAAEVHRSLRFTPRAFLRQSSGLPPPSYAEAVGNEEGPSPTHWVTHLSDRPPNYSSPLPRVTTAVVTTHAGRDTHRRASIKPEVWGPYPTRASCSRCRRVGLSQVVAEDVEFTHLCALALCLLGCWPCCLLPYCMSSCRRVWHVCPRCGHYMGVYYPRPPSVHTNTPEASETNV